MSTLLAVNCNYTRMLPVSDTYSMDMIRQAMHDKRSIEVVVFMLEYMEYRVIIIDNLHLACDGWGIEHIEGTILEEGELS